MRRPGQSFVSDVRPIRNVPFGVREQRSRFWGVNKLAKCSVEREFSILKSGGSAAALKKLRLLAKLLGLFTQKRPNVRAKSFPCNLNKCFNLASRMRLYSLGENL